MSETTDKALAPMGGSKPRKAECPEHGEYISRYIRIPRRQPAPGPLEGWTTCPICSLIQVKAAGDEELRRQQEERDQLAQRQQERRLAGAMIPPRFLSKTFENYEAALPEQQHALQVLQGYANDFEQVLASGRCLLLIGDTGTGKTHLSCAVANAIVRRGYSALFRTVQELVRHVRSTWGQPGRSAEEAIAELVRPDLLILDEVGVQYGSDSELVTLFDVMNARYSANKPCIVLSNLSLDEVRACLGDRIFDRLRENDGQAVPFDWVSRRSMGGQAHG